MSSFTWRGTTVVVLVCLFMEGGGWLFWDCIINYVLWQGSALTVSVLYACIILLICCNRKAELFWRER